MSELNFQSADELEKIIKFLQSKLDVIRAEEYFNEKEKDYKAKRRENNPWDIFGKNNTPTYTVHMMALPLGVREDVFNPMNDEQAIGVLACKDKDECEEMALKVHTFKSILRLAAQDSNYHSHIKSANYYLEYNFLDSEYRVAFIDPMEAEAYEIMTPYFTTEKCAQKVCDWLNEGRKLPAVYDDLWEKY